MIGQDSLESDETYTSEKVRITPLQSVELDDKQPVEVPKKSMQSTAQAPAPVVKAQAVSDSDIQIRMLQVFQNNNLAKTDKLDANQSKAAISEFCAIDLGL